MSLKKVKILILLQDMIIESAIKSYLGKTVKIQIDETFHLSLFISPFHETFLSFLFKWVKMVKKETESYGHGHSYEL